MRSKSKGSSNFFERTDWSLLTPNLDNINLIFSEQVLIEFLIRCRNWNTKDSLELSSTSMMPSIPGASQWSIVASRNSFQIDPHPFEVDLPRKQLLSCIASHSIFIFNYLHKFLNYGFAFVPSRISKHMFARI